MTHGDRGLRRPAPVLLALEGQSHDPGGGATLSLDGDEDGRYRCSAVAVRPPGSDVCDNDWLFEFVVGEKRLEGSGEERAGLPDSGPHGRHVARADDLARSALSCRYTG